MIIEPTPILREPIFRRAFWAAERAPTCLNGFRPPSWRQLRGFFWAH